MKRVFVSVPMSDKSDDEIRQAIVKLHQIAELLEGQQLTLVDNFDPDALTSDSAEPYNKECMHLLSKAIDKMAECDIFIGVETWGYRGCMNEARIANDYGLKVYMMNYKYIFGEFEECHDDGVRGLREATNECVANNC